MSGDTSKGLAVVQEQIKELEAGETVGYGRRGHISKPSRIATIRLGYADGYPRSLGNGAGKLLVKGQLVPTIGSVYLLFQEG